MECVICGKEITPDFHLLYRGEGVCFHCAAYLEGVTKMPEEEKGHIIQHPLREAIEEEKRKMSVEDELRKKWYSEDLDDIEVGSIIFNALCKATKGYDIDVMVEVE